VSGTGHLTIPSHPGTKLAVGDAGVGALNILNGGTVSAISGGLVIVGAAASGNGTVNVSAGSWSADFDLTIGTLGTGTVAITNGGYVTTHGAIIGEGTASNGALTLDGPGSQYYGLLGLSVGSAGSGSLSVTNGATVVSREADVAGYGGGTGTASVTGAGSRWDNIILLIGTVGVGDVTIADGAVVHVDPYFDGTRKVILGPTGTLNIGTGGLSGTLETITVQNAGTLNFNHSDNVLFSTEITGAGNVLKSGSGTTTLTNVAGATGQIASNGGTLIVQNSVGSTLFGATNGGTLRFDGNTVNLASSGLIRSLAGSTVEYNAATVNGGFLRGPGTHHIVANLNSSKFGGVTTYNSVELLQDSPATLTNFTNGGTLTNNATLTFDGGTNTSSGHITVNALMSAADLTSNGVININAGGTLEHSFANLVAGGGSRTTVHPGGTIELLSGSELDVNGGLLTNDGTISGTVNVNYGSLAKGAGTYGVVNVNEGGVYAPGSSPGISTAAAVEFENGNFSTAAPRLVMELAGATAGTQYDQLHVTGPLSLAGVLEVMLVNGFVPSAGQSFDILDWGSLAGTFTSLALPPLAGLAWNTDQLYSTGVIRVVADAGLPGDFNNDGAVNAADYIPWRKGIGVASTPANYNLWHTNFGRTAAGGSLANAPSVPEPRSVILLAGLTPILNAAYRLRLRKLPAPAKNRG
jgi:T5SS/PEP-CTERM-associated repeat protein